MATIRLGEYLIEQGLLDEKQLEIAIGEQARVGGRLGEILVELGMVSEEAVTVALAFQSGVEQLEVESTPIDPAALALVPADLARRFELVPVRIEDGNLLVAMANPSDIVAIDELQRRTDLFVRVVAAGPQQIRRARDRAYALVSSGQGPYEELIQACLAELEAQGDEAGRGSVVRLLDELLTDAIRREGTDLHFEPSEKVVRTRVRLDGDLHAGPTLPPSLLAQIVARVKVMAHLNIAETRVPQDGKIRLDFEGRKIDLRVSTLPALSGEGVVIRILDSKRQDYTLASVGLDEREQVILRRVARRPNGLILAAGPTGSGKTTTLFAMLREASSPRLKVITLEDPVEYELPMALQCQINEKAGLTFAAGLRAILRHDPDTVLVGEMRDGETATIAMRASLTGHLVLSTIHTNSSARTVTRLRDMDIEPFLISSSLACVVGQRLVRLNCKHCASEYAPSPEELTAVGIAPGTAGHYARGPGCEHCRQTGCLGRQALFEVLEVTPEIAKRIARGAPVDEIEEAAIAGGMATFRQQAQRRAQEGRISLEEVARITAEG